MRILADGGEIGIGFAFFDDNQFVPPGKGLPDQFKDQVAVASQPAEDRMPLEPAGDAAKEFFL